MVGLEKLQLFTAIDSSEGEDFYAPMIKSFGYFCKPQAFQPEGGFQNHTFLEIGLFQNSSNLNKNFQYQAVYLEGIINPIQSTSPITNVPFSHTVKVIYEDPSTIIELLQDFSYIEWDIFFDGVSYPLASPIVASLNSSNQSLSFTASLLWLTPGAELEPQYKISGRYYLI